MGFWAQIKRNKTEALRAIKVGGFLAGVHLAVLGLWSVGVLPFLNMSGYLAGALFGTTALLVYVCYIAELNGAAADIMFDVSGGWRKDFREARGESEIKTNILNRIGRSGNDGARMVTIATMEEMHGRGHQLQH